MPLFCLEGVVECDNKFILVRRKKSPAKNKWWFPGGRLFFNEDLVPAVKRILKEELGIKKTKSVEIFGVAGSKFKVGYFGLPSHTVNAIFFARIDNFQAKHINLDKVNHYDYKWFKNIPKNVSAHIKKFLKLSGFK